MSVWSRGVCAPGGGVCSWGMSGLGGLVLYGAPGGVCSWGWVGVWSGGCLLLWGVCYWGVSGLGGLVPGGCAPGGGVSGPRGPGGLVSQHALRQTDTPLWTDTRLWKYNLRNFVADGNKSNFLFWSLSIKLHFDFSLTFITGTKVF